MKTTKTASSPDVHETMRTTDKAYADAKRSREQLTAARERAETAEAQGYERENDARMAYEAARESLTKRYPASARR